MKKILSIFLLGMLFITTAKAQTAFSQTASNPTGAFSNAAVDTMTYTALRSYNLVSIQPVLTKLTGTMAGTVVLDISVNGTNWQTVQSTFTLADVAANTTVWNVATAARYFRIRTLSTGSNTGTATAKIIAAN